VAASGTACWRIGRGEPGYPPQLEQLERPPAALHGLGDRTLIAGLALGEAVTVVGSRRASAHALAVAEGLARDLAAAGIVVVSGMALGIDAAAHRGALAGGGRTVTVLGGGPDVIYPARERRLYRQILASGAIVSERPPKERPTPGSFPARNRIMAALSAMTVVVEAALPSGSMITATEALDLGREVGAVPGLVTARNAAGTNDLIANGAKLVRGAADVLDAIGPVGRTRAAACGPGLEPALAAALDAVELGAATADALAAAAGLGGREAMVALTRLELLGYARADPAGRVARTALRRP